MSCSICWDMDRMLRKNVPSPSEFWFDEPIDGMDVGELEEYLSSLQELKGKVLNRADELRMINNAPAFFGSNLNNNTPIQDVLQGVQGHGLNVMHGVNGPNVMQHLHGHGPNVTQELKEITTNFGKLDKFEGHDFRRWQKKMHFLLTTLKVVYVLTTPMPELLEDAIVEAIRIRAKWENDDYICIGHILNGMSDSLFDVYTNIELAKELWDSLESKYMAKDSSSKKFLDFKHTFKHGKDDRSLVQLGSHLRIEESLRVQDSNKSKGKEVGGPSVNMTEKGG
nr:zinc finger, CCHC-type [Tanacetum cinerariifolium]